MLFSKKFKNIFHITIWEALIALAAIVTYFVLKATLHHVPLAFIIFGFVVGTWLAFRPSEWAVLGLDSGSKYVGLSDYVAGILSSLASNLPEAVIAIILIVKFDKILVAVITVLSAAGFNALILGIAILLSTLKKRGHIAVPRELEQRESPIIRWAIVALIMTVVFGFVQYAYYGKDNLESAVLTKPVAALLAASYLFYLIYIIAIKENDGKLPKIPKENDIHKTDETEEETSKVDKHDDHEKLSIWLTILLLVLGFVGIYFGGETLTESVNHLIEGIPFFLTSKGQITAALILGAAGAVPEHGIAIISAAKDEIEVGIGNAMGGILQSALLIFGILGIIVSITMHPFILLQLASIAVTLWFVKRCIHDGKFDTFEGIMIIILQILIFIILFEDIAFFG